MFAREPSPVPVMGQQGRENPPPALPSVRLTASQESVSEGSCPQREHTFPQFPRLDVGGHGSGRAAASEASLLGWYLAAFALCPHTGFPL